MKVKDILRESAEKARLCCTVKNWKILKICYFFKKTYHISLNNDPNVWGCVLFCIFAYTEYDICFFLSFSSLFICFFILILFSLYTVFNYLFCCSIYFAFIINLLLLLWLICEFD